MCDVAAEAVVMNGYAGRCLMINKDVRRMDTIANPDGMPADMDKKANLCIYEARAPATTIQRLQALRSNEATTYIAHIKLQ